MGVTAAFLCDFAEVREGLLFMTAGGVTRLYRSEYPAEMGVCLAVVVEASRMERDRPHELIIDILDEDGKMVAKAQAGYQIGSAGDVAIHESQLLPINLDLRNVQLEHAGWYSIDISLDGRQERSLQFRAGPRPDTATPAPS